jgi:hypothetical protein
MSSVWLISVSLMVWRVYIDFIPVSATGTALIAYLSAVGAFSM